MHHCATVSLRSRRMAFLQYGFFDSAIIFYARSCRDRKPWPHRPPTFDRAVSVFDNRKKSASKHWSASSASVRSSAREEASADARMRRANYVSNLFSSSQEVYCPNNDTTDQDRPILPPRHVRLPIKLLNLARILYISTTVSFF